MLWKYLILAIGFTVTNVVAVHGSQQILVEPFLQQAVPTSIWVVWETDQGKESRVDYGLTSSLGSTKIGAAIPKVESSIIHQAKLTGLSALNDY